MHAWPQVCNDGNDIIKAMKVNRELNLADVGTHYCTRAEMAYFLKRLRGSGSRQA